MAFRLREYQTRCLDALGVYLSGAAADGAKRAFVIQTERRYLSVPQLPELPYVCLRVPTGGGKTIMAAHAVGIAAHRFLQRDQAVCLWLVPSNAILEQTLGRLRTEGDPYREALVSHFGGRATVMNLEEALYVQRGVLDGETVVIVSTLAALRVEDTEGRKVYEQNGALEHHFTGLPRELCRGLELREDGQPIESLANVLRLRHPVIVMDEAHTARTKLSFDTLARIAPSCVLEFTATPETRHTPEAGHFASNVLAHVSAAELKAEDMIKLPVRLWARPGWSDAVTDAVAKQRELEAEAAREQRLSGEQIRPIVLFQAEANRQGGAPITVEVLEKCLVDDHRIPRDQIAVATGDRRELDGLDLTDAACPIRFIITVQALREGWDCPWAYVLCSVANQASPRAVEQILGRVLRLPGARRKAHEPLNRSYAYVVSPSFAAAAEALRDGLVENGFERFETEVLVEDGGGLPGLFAARAGAPVKVVVRERPNLEYLDAATRAAVTFDPTSMTLTATAPISAVAAEQLAESVKSSEAKAIILSFARESREGSAAAAAAPRPPAGALVFPMLSIRVAGTLELFEESHFLDVPWRVSDHDAKLTDAEFPLKVQGGAEGQVDVTAAGQLQVTFRDEVASQLSMLDGEPGWTLPALAVWLDRRIPHPDLTQPDVSLFIHKVLEDLIGRTGVTLGQLARDKYRLRKALANSIEAHRAAQRGKAFQAALFDGAAGGVEVTSEVTRTLGDSDRYAPNYFYEGAYQFRHHLFPLIGELGSEGDEHRCAVHLDEHPQVECWIRNLERRVADSFWLQTSRGRFYPDFIGRLKDGRVFAVEFKGEHLWSADDAREKRTVGQLWAERSGGQCIFVMPKGTAWGEIDAAFQPATD